MLCCRLDVFFSLGLLWLLYVVKFCATLVLIVVTTAEIVFFLLFGVVAVVNTNFLEVFWLLTKEDSHSLSHSLIKFIFIANDDYLPNNI